MSKGNLAMAYAMKRKGKKMAHGGMVDDDEPEAGENEGMAGSDEMEPDESMSIKVPMHDMVKHIIAKRLASGGEVNEADSADGIDDQYSEMPEADDDFLSDEEQTPLPNEDMKSKRRGLLDSIMSKK